MMRLDHNRAIAMLANKVRGGAVTDVTQMGVWGNHLPTMYPDLFHAEVPRRACRRRRSTTWRGSRMNSCRTSAPAAAAIIEARGSSSAASAASAAIDHMSDSLLLKPTNDWVSMGVSSDGSYGIPEGLICGLPVCLQRRQLRDRRGPLILTTSRAPGKIDASVAVSSASATPSRARASFRPRAPHKRASAACAPPLRIRNKKERSHQNRAPLCKPPKPDVRDQGRRIVVSDRTYPFGAQAGSAWCAPHTSDRGRRQGRRD